jgi:prepilin-type N-terminal cleavage/methylation domain-containing protein
MWVIKTFTQREAYVRKERGFTLIELLVVIAILAVLFGLTALALNGVGSDAEEVAAEAEADTVQTAIDVCIALDSCTDPSEQTDPEVVGPSTDTPGGFGTYLRRSTKYQFEWDADGNVLCAQDADGNDMWRTCP